MKVSRRKVCQHGKVLFPSLPDLEISAALGIYKLLKDTGPELQISRKEGSHTDGVAGRTRLTHRLGREGGRKRLSGDRKTGRMDWRGKTGGEGENRNRGADSFLHPGPRRESLSSFVL